MNEWCIPYQACKWNLSMTINSHSCDKACYDILMRENKVKKNRLVFVSRVRWLKNKRRRQFLSYANQKGALLAIWTGEQRRGLCIFSAAHKIDLFVLRTHVQSGSKNTTWQVAIANHINTYIMLPYDSSYKLPAGRELMANCYLYVKVDSPRYAIIYSSKIIKHKHVFISFTTLNSLRPSDAYIRR